MGFKVDDIISKFLVKVVPPINRRPDYETIHNIFQCLYRNSATLPNTLRGGGHGHIGIIMKPTLYATVAHTAYVSQYGPGMVPDVPGTVTVTVSECEQQQDHKKVLKTLYKNHVNMDTSLMTLIIDAVKDCFLAEQQNRYMGYLGVVNINLVEHLMQLYRNITASNMQTKKACMYEDINTTHTKGGYFKKNDDTVQFSAGGNTPFTAKTILQTGYHDIMVSGNMCTPARSGGARTQITRHYPNTRHYSRDNIMTTMIK